MENPARSRDRNRDDSDGDRTLDFCLFLVGVWGLRVVCVWVAGAVDGGSKGGDQCGWAGRGGLCEAELQADELSAGHLFWCVPLLLAMRLGLPVLGLKHVFCTASQKA